MALAIYGTISLVFVFLIVILLHASKLLALTVIIITMKYMTPLTTLGRGEVLLLF